MRHRESRVALAFASLALLAALAPAPPAAQDGPTLKGLAERRAAVAGKIADFFADPRLSALEGKGEVRSLPGVDQVELWTRRFVDARLEAAPDRDERVAILAKDLERTKAIEARIKAIADNEPGFAKLDSFKAEYYRLDAEYRLLKEKAGN